MKILIIGCGFLGKHVAESLKHNASVTVTKTTSQSSVSDVHLEILKPSNYSKISKLVETFDTIIVTASSSNYNYETSYLVLARSLKKALNTSKNKTLIYTSSTGVYSESSGGVVFENSPLDLERSHILVETEKTYLSLKNTRVVIFRLSGLIGHSERTLRQMYARYENTPLYPRMANFIYAEEAACAIKYAVFHPIRGLFNLSSFTEKNTDIFKKIFNKDALLSSVPNMTHGGSKKIITEKIRSQPNFSNLAQRIKIL